MKTTRRKILTGVIATAISLGTSQPDLARIHGGIGTGASPGASTSLTFVNKSVSNSPATTPLTVSKTFARGAVPTGFIAVPNISGSPLTYQADNRKYWDDGSLYQAVFRCLTGVINAGATTQVTFPISAGSYTNTSSKTTADITGSSDYKIAITNLHTAQTALVNQLAVSPTISGGVVTGGTCWSNLGGFSGTLNVSGAGGTGAQLSVSGTTVAVVSPGSGYSNVGSGSVNIGFNSIVSAVGMSGNHNGASLVQYAKGPVCDAWRARSPVAGVPHLHATFYVERWKDGSGNFLAFRAYCIHGVGLIDTVNALPNYTYSLDWKNGSTVIRGTTNGDIGFTNNTVYMGGSAATFGQGTSSIGYVDTARPDWSANSAVLNAIIVQPTPTEADQIKHAGQILPWLAITPTVPQPTVPAAYTIDGQEDNFICIYQPNGSAGIRCSFGAGGSGHNEAPMPDSNTLHWMWLRAGNTANANTWLVNCRTAAAHGMGAVVTGSGLYDPTTLYVPNVIPAAAQAFSGMTPTLENHYAGDLTMTGYCHPMLEGGGPLYTISVYHQPFYLAYPYVLEGEQWMADAMLNAGTCEQYCQSQAYHRQVSLGATTYYGVWGNQAVNERVPAWGTMAAIYAATLPTAWADGATNIEQSYAAYLAGNTARYLNALIPFTGIVQLGTAEPAITKTVDYTNTGVYPEIFLGSFNTLACETAVPFMSDYTAMVYSVGSYLLQGTAAGAALSSFINYYKRQYVGLYSYAGAHYLNDGGYRLNATTNPNPNSPASDPNWSSEGNVSAPALAVYPHNAGGALPIVMNFTSGNPTIQLVDLGGSTPDSMTLVGSTRIANGSRIKLTTTNIETEGALWATLPTNFDGVTWYYWLELTPTTGRLCTDAGLTSPVTPGSGPSQIFFWVVPSNTLPANNSGAGTYNAQGSTGGSSRFATKLGTCRMMKRYGISDAGFSVADAITNLDTIFTAVNGSDSAGFSGYPLYAWDSAA